MNQKLCFIFLALFFYKLHLFAQKNLTIHFTPTYHDVAIQMHQPFFNRENSDTIELTTLKFYISAIQLYYQNQVCWTESNSYHLVDIENNDSISLDLPSNVLYDKLSFQLGVDSVTNVSGAMDGSLDPLKGMYWTWQSGYINFKLEAAESSGDKIIYHLGGYNGAQNSLQKLQFLINPNHTTFYCNLNLKSIFSATNLSHTKHLMTPGTDAVNLLHNIALDITLEP